MNEIHSINDEFQNCEMLKKIRTEKKRREIIRKLVSHSIWIWIPCASLQSIIWCNIASFLFLLYVIKNDNDGENMTAFFFLHITRSTIPFFSLQNVKYEIYVKFLNEIQPLSLLFSVTIISNLLTTHEILLFCYIWLKTSSRLWNRCKKALR